MAKLPIIPICFDEESNKMLRDKSKDSQRSLSSIIRELIKKFISQV